MTQQLTLYKVASIRLLCWPAAARIVQMVAFLKAVILMRTNILKKYYATYKAVCRRYKITVLDISALVWSDRSHSRPV